MTVRGLRSGILAVVVASGTALAEAPAALDRVPADAAVVASIRNLQEFHDNIMGLKQILPALDIDLGDAEAMMGADGLNANGSIALALFGGEGGLDLGNDATMVMVVPVSDYGALVSGFGGDPAAGVAEVQVHGETVFAKDLGGGYAAIGPSLDLVEGFDGEPGHMKAQETRCGAAGARVGDEADTFIVADVSAFEPMIRAKFAEMKQTMQMMAQMAGPQGEQMATTAAAMEQMTDAFLRDASVGFVGIDFSGEGIALDFGTQFKEGSPAAGYFQAEGDASTLLGRVPAGKYLFAVSMDTSSPGMRRLAAKANEISMKLNPAAEGMEDVMNPGWFLERSDGFAAVMGQPPSLFGGVLSKLSYYIATEDPAGFVGAYRDAQAKMNDQTVNGLTFLTNYQPESAEINGTAVDSWSLQMKADPSVPGALQQQQGLMMIFGPQMGPSGYTAQVDNGVIFTLSQDTPLMASALEAAATGNGVGADAGLMAVATHLHPNSTFVMYWNVDNILDMVSGVMAMAGQQLPFQAPENLKPIGIGATTDGGGLGARVFLPMDVIKFFGDMASVAQDGMGPEGGERPRF